MESPLGSNFPPISDSLGLSWLSFGLILGFPLGLSLVSLGFPWLPLASLGFPWLAVTLGLILTLTQAWQAQDSDYSPVGFSPVLAKKPGDVTESQAQLTGLILV